MRIQPIDREHAQGKARELLVQLAVGGFNPVAGLHPAMRSAA
jgi:hypothetical protein